MVIVLPAWAKALVSRKIETVTSARRPMFEGSESRDHF